MCFRPQKPKKRKERFGVFYLQKIFPKRYTNNNIHVKSNVTVKDSATKLI